MTSCDRFESEGLARFVAGQLLEPHFETCADCRAARASYEAVALALQQAREAYEPPGDWEAKVWARIQSGRAPQRSRWAVLLGVAATAAALAVFFVSSVGGTDALTLSTNFERGSGLVVRGGASRGGDVQSAAPGDVLHLLVKVPRGKVGDLRVYRGTNELVFQCAKSPACIHSKDGLEARVTLDRAGTYRAVIVAADKELPAVSGSLDADYAAALRSGPAKESAPIEVL
jgi:hypothetical protein